MHRKKIHPGCLGCLGRVLVLSLSFLVMSWCCFGVVSVLSRWCLGRVSVLSLSFLGDVSVLLWWCLGDVSVVSRSCLCLFWVMSRCCCGVVWVLSCLCVGSVMFRCCFGDVSVMSQSCLGRLSVVSRSCLCFFLVMSRAYSVKSPWCVVMVLWCLWWWVGDGLVLCRWCCSAVFFALVMVFWFFGDDGFLSKTSNSNFCRLCTFARSCGPYVDGWCFKTEKFMLSDMSRPCLGLVSVVSVLVLCCLGDVSGCHGDVSVLFS